MAESCRDVQGQHIGTDLYRTTSYGSSNAGNADFHIPLAQPDSYEAIEADLNRLKKEVVQLKQRNSREGSAAGIEEDSPATRLQRAHDRLRDSVQEPRPEQLEAPAPPSAKDFPALGSFKSATDHPSSVLNSAFSATQVQRKPSYASVATVNMRDAIDKGPSTSRIQRADSQVNDTPSEGPLTAASAHSLSSTFQHATTLTTSQPSSHAGARRSFEHDDDEGSVIVSPQSINISEALPILRGMPSSPNEVAAKDAPRFAQPTQSFARRAGEALRKDSSSAALKQAAGEKSPTKRQNKRKSLPDGWVGPRSPHKGHAGADAASSPPVYSSPTSNGEWQLVDRVVAREPSVAARTSEPQLRKKVSSYMSPTAATTQRTIATLGEENAKRKPGTLRVNTNQANQYASLASPDSNALSSASSLPSSIMARTGFGSSGSPPSPQRQVHRGVDTILARSSAPPTPKGVRHAGAVSKGPDPPNSPSKIPRARKPLTSKLQNLPANTAQKASTTTSSSLLDVVANTTTRRRTSHADILKPIFDKLDSQGLRKGYADPLHVSHDARPSESAAGHNADARRPVRNLLLENPRKASPGLEDIALLTRQGLGIKKKTVVPPHLRASRQSSIASDGSDLVTTVRAPAQLPSVTATVPQLARLQDAAVEEGASLGSDRTPDAVSSVQTSMQGPSPASALRATFGTEQTPNKHQTISAQLPRPSPASSLRATAPDFTPLWQPQNPVQELRLLSWQGALDHKPDEEWSPLPGEVRNSIQTLREYTARGQSPAGTFPSRSRSPSKRQEQRFWGNLMALSGSSSTAPTIESIHAGAPVYDRDSNVEMSDVGGEGRVNTTSPNGVQIGQVLKPALSPGKKSVKWTLQDTDGQEKPVSFGRAPAPIVTVVDEMETGETPVVSPTPIDTSPLKTPHSAHGAHGAHAWTIGSGGFAPGYYGWEGGDGKEISFTGYGPYAERDPNSPVNMQFLHGTPGSFGASPQAAGMRLWSDSSGKNAAPTPKVWPKSMRQWAEFAGHDRVPCGGVEITEAIEHVPFASPFFGYCNDCVPARTC